MPSDTEPHTKVRFRNTLRSEQNVSHFMDDILNPFTWISIITFDLEIKDIRFREYCYNKSALIQVMTWSKWGDTLLV